MSILSFSIPSTTGQPTTFELGAGNVLYVLGANGTGKSSLISHLYAQCRERGKRISAHRQTWFESNTLDITPRNRLNLENNVRNHDAHPHARYREYGASERAGMAIYDLIDADTMSERRIAELVRAGNIDLAQREAQNPSPMQVINELMQLSNIPIKISLEDGQKVVACKNGGKSYSVAELSDGERNAFLIAADILTAKPGTLILIDEPERHLHRSIVSPLLRLLFGRRSDCAFIVSTHELMLPLDTPDASTILVRDCDYQGQNAQSWTTDLLAPGALIDDQLKADILGSRRKIIFVEGTAQSLDAPLYSLLFPQISIIPKDSCREVEYAVRGLRGTSGIHWASAWGIVDNDQRSAEDIARLREAGVWALPHFSVESLYYHPTIVTRVANRQAYLIGGNPDDYRETALSIAIDATNFSREHLVTSSVLRLVRNNILNRLPSRNEIQSSEELLINIDVKDIRVAEESRFDSLILSKDWNGLLTRYPIRESSAFQRIVDGLRIKDKSTYTASVLKLLREDAEAVAELRNLLGDLHSIVAQ